MAATLSASAAISGIRPALGMEVGARFGARFGRSMEIVGGLVLVALGLKILIDHLR